MATTDPPKYTAALKLLDGGELFDPTRLYCDKQQEEIKECKLVFHPDRNRNCSVKFQETVKKTWLRFQTQYEEYIKDPDVQKQQTDRKDEQVKRNDQAERIAQLKRAERVEQLKRNDQAERRAQLKRAERVEQLKQEEAAIKAAEDAAKAEAECKRKRAEQAEQADADAVAAANAKAEAEADAANAEADVIWVKTIDGIVISDSD